jgi:hypothetical protein
MNNKPKRLKPETAERLKQMLNEQPASRTGYGKSSASQQITWVRITGETSGMYYICIPSGYDAIRDEWVEYVESFAVEAKGRALATDEYYLATRTGDVDGTSVYMISVPGLPTDEVGSGSGSGAVAQGEEAVTDASCSGGTLLVTKGTPFVEIGGIRVYVQWE